MPQLALDSINPIELETEPPTVHAMGSVRDACLSDRSRRDVDAAYALRDRCQSTSLRVDNSAKNNSPTEWIHLRR